MKLRKTLLGVMVALAGLTLTLPPRALAQTPDRLTSLKISIWPEFDKPSVLVLLDGVLADPSNLPRPVSVLIPSDAELSVTTWTNPDGSFAPEQPAQQTKQDDGYTRVTFTIAQPRFRVEYYHDLLRGAPDKTLDFVYKSSGAIDTVTLEIQQPLKATNWTMNPPAPNTRTDSDGFKYFSYAFSNIAAGQTITAQAKYTKSDPNPSVQPQAAPTVVPAASESNNRFGLLALVALGLTAILGFFWLRRRSPATRPAANVMSRKARRGKRPAGLTTAAVFCTQCGHPLRLEDNFCPKCGTKRRVQG